MAERRYNLRFSLPEGCVILIGLFLTSLLVFLFGVHVGKEVQVRKAVQQGRTVRLPVSLSDSESSSFFQAPAQTPSLIPKSTNPASAVLTPQHSQSLQQESNISSPSHRAISEETPTRASTSTGTVAAKTGTVAAKPVSPQEKKPSTPSAPKRRWSVQVHVTHQQRVAQEMAKSLREQGYTPLLSKIIRQGETWYRVRVGNFANEEQAKETVARFRREGTFPQAYPVSE